MSDITTTAQAAAPIANVEAGTVFAVKADGKTSYINLFDGLSKNGDQWGYIKLRSSVNQYGKRIGNSVVRTTNYVGAVAFLESMVKDIVSKTDGSLPGRLTIKEFVFDADFMDEDNATTREYARRMQANDDVEELIANYVKRDGKALADGTEAPTLKVGDEPILRFTDYDFDGEDTDQFVAYDNLDEVNAWRAAKKAAGVLAGS